MGETSPNIPETCFGISFGTSTSVFLVAFRDGFQTEFEWQLTAVIN